MRKKTHEIEPPGDGPTAGAKSKKAKRQPYKSPGFSSYYTNDIHIETTPWDVRLILGEIEQIPTAENPVLVVRQNAEVRFSPQQAVVLIGMLGDQLSAYVQAYGDIPIPKQLKAKFALEAGAESPDQ